jgi:hypothetical protein
LSHYRNRIPVVTTASLVLGLAACADSGGDEETGDVDDPSLERDAGRDGAVGADASDDAAWGGDAGDGDGDGAVPDGNMDVSQERQDRVASQFCEASLQCFEDQEYTQMDCEQAYAEYFDDFDDRGEACFDAFLDYFECGASLDCEQMASEDEVFCDTQGLEQHCDSLNGSIRLQRLR